MAGSAVIDPVIKRQLDSLHERLRYLDGICDEHGDWTNHKDCHLCSMVHDFIWFTMRIWQPAEYPIQLWRRRSNCRPQS
jgi:hypothetical protein